MLLTISNIGRYQCLVGGNKVKIIGNVLIDNGIIKKFVVNQYQLRVKYWASDIIVLRLYSAVIVGKILSVEGHQDQTTQVDLCLVLFFMRVHLVDVN